FLHYPPNTLISGKNLFRWFVDTLFELKKKDKRFKEILNCCWGVLVQEKKTRLCIDLTKESDVNLNTDEIEILSQIIEKDKCIIEYTYKNTSCFKTDFGRLKPFLLSQGRLKMSKLLVDQMEFIESLNTDGWKSSKKLDIELGDGIGQVRYEGSRNVKIIHVNKIVEI
ncbi:MAG: hypothetical protein WCJ33_07565, partial [Pseudomonadota bacterium]